MTRLDAFRQHPGWPGDQGLMQVYLAGDWPPGWTGDRPADAPPAPKKAARKARTPRKKGSSPCPICKEPYVDRFDKMKVPMGRWVHPGCVPAEADRIQREAAEAGSSGQWLPLTVPSDISHALRAPQLPKIEFRPGTRYEKTDIFRILARNDESGFRLVHRLVERMMERQTEDEKKYAKTRHLNMQGFNQPDAKRSAQLLSAYRKQGYSPGVHFWMSKMLLRYLNTQLPDIMSYGAAQKGTVARTNPEPQQYRIMRPHSGIGRTHYVGTLKELIEDQTFVMDGKRMSPARACGLTGTVAEVEDFFAGGGRVWRPDEWSAYYIVKSS